MLERYGWLLLAVAFMWILQLMLSLLQTKKFYKQYSELKKDGDTSSIGMSGSNWKRKVYGVLVVDDQREIIHAQKLSGFTVFAKLKPVDKLVGHHLSDLENTPESLALDKKLVAAFRNAAEFIRNHDRKQALQEETA